MPLILPFVPSPLTLITSSLPKGAVGVPYSATLAASGGLPPYNWSITGQDAQGFPTLNAQTGVLSGTPSQVEGLSLGITVTDQLNGSASATIPLAVPGLPPQSIWMGRTTSSDQIVTSWPPTSGTPTSYSLYRSTNHGAFVQIANGVTPKPWPMSSPSANQIFIWDLSLQPSTTYTYYWTAVYGTAESVPGPMATITTLSGQVTALNPTTPPLVPTDPASYIQPYSLPNVTPLGGGVLASVNAVTSALTSANPNGPNLIVLQAGMVFDLASNINGFTMPVLNAAGSLYFISSEDPVFKSGGALPAYSVINTDQEYTSLTFSSAPAAAATGATLSPNQSGFTDASGNWLKRTGYFPIVFTSSAGNETRVGSFVNGSSSVSWVGGVGLAGSAGTTFYVYVSNWVTPADIASMPTIRAGVLATNDTRCITCNGTQNIRFVGINFTPPVNAGPNVVTIDLIEMDTVCTNVMFDRCVFGQQLYAFGQTGFTYSNIAHGMQIACDKFVASQCWTWGMVQIGAANPSDAAGYFVLQGNGICVQNCFIEAASEGFISGGSFLSRADPPANIVFRDNYCYKPTEWAQQAGANPTQAQNPGNWAKNHWEMKSVYTAACYRNVFQNNWSGNAGAQHGRAIVLTPRDQLSNTASTPITSLNPWCRITNVSVYNNKVYNCTRGVQCGGWDGAATSYTAFVSVTNNLFQNQVCNLYNPRLIQTNGGLDPSYGFEGSVATDVLVENNTFACNSAQFTGFSAGQYVQRAQTTQPAYQVSFERATTINNIYTGYNYGLYIAIGTSGTASWAPGWQNSVCSNTIFPAVDTNSYAPSGTFTNNFQVAFANIGFANAGTISTPVVPASNWDVTAAPYNTASTTGGPLGATF